MKDGAKTWVVEQVGGGIVNGGSEKCYYRKNVWHWNREDKTLWLYKWGEVPNPASPDTRSNRTRSGTTREVQEQSSGFRQWAILIIAIVIAISASIYFDNGEEITW